MAPPAVWKYILDIFYELLKQCVKFICVVYIALIIQYYNIHPLYINIFYVGITNDLCFSYESCNANF